MLGLLNATHFELQSLSFFASSPVTNIVLKMKILFKSTVALWIGAVAGGGLFTAGAQEQPPANPPAAAEPSDQDFAAQDGVSVLMRGPVHEAYAEQFDADPESGVVVSQQPPEPIRELPPNYKPDVEGITWIPGYWGWDPDGEEFIWVSGVWRRPPPNQAWIPGYWTANGPNYQWIAGFWRDQRDDMATYLPAPPPAIDQGPSQPAPGENRFWVAGNWVYEEDEYAWQSGYWSTAVDQWVWVPTRYVWTPSGCIYRAGYWDYQLANRGTLFCPVRFANPGVSGLQYRPDYVVQVSPLWYANLFVYPQYHHYFYGDYYSYSGQNAFYPWVNYSATTQRYDPLYSYLAYQNNNANMFRQLSQLHRYFDNNASVRPGRTVAGVRQRSKSLTAGQQSLDFLAAPLATLAGRDADFDMPFQMQKIDESTRKQLEDSVGPARGYVDARRKLERASDDNDRARAMVQTDETLAQNRDRENKPVQSKNLQLPTRRPASGALTTEPLATRNSDRNKPSAEQQPVSPDIAKVRDQQADKQLNRPPTDRDSTPAVAGQPIRSSDQLDTSRQRFSAQEIAARRAEMRTQKTDAARKPIDGGNPEPAGRGDQGQPSSEELQRLREQLNGKALRDDPNRKAAEIPPRPSLAAPTSPRDKSMQRNPAQGTLPSAEGRSPLRPGNVPKNQAPQPSPKPPVLDRPPAPSQPAPKINQKPISDKGKSQNPGKVKSDKK